MHFQQMTEVFLQKFLIFLHSTFETLSRNSDFSEKLIKLVHGTGKSQFRQHRRFFFYYSFFIFRSKPNIQKQLGTFQRYYPAQNFLQRIEVSFDNRDEKVSR